MKTKKLLAFTLTLLMFSTHFSNAAEIEKYTIDTSGAHAFIQFRVNHLGYSWLYGRFNQFEGNFQLNPKDNSEAKISLTIDTASVDTNHAERDKHLRSNDFLNVKKFPQATFKSTQVNIDNIGKGTIIGNLTLNGITKAVELSIEQIGEGKDPWGGYRRGYQAETTFKLSDFNITYELGPASQYVEMILSIEGVRK